MNAEDCNEYREKYPDMSDEQLVAWHSRLWREHRKQKHFNSDAIQRFFAGIKRDCYVTEIGGWDGEMAKSMLAKHDNILTWDNYEICEEARENSVCSDDRYVARHPDDFCCRADVLVASHVLEHMSADEIVLALRFMLKRAKHFYVDVPAAHELKDSTSFHIVGDAMEVVLPMLVGWEEVGVIGTARGYRRIK